MMTNRDCGTLVEEIASNVMMAEAGDKDELTQISTLLDELTESIPGDPEGGVHQLARNCSETLQGIIDGVGEDAEADLEILCTRIDKLQNEIKNLKDGVEDKAVEAASETPEANVNERHFTLPEWIDENVFRDFIAAQPHVLEEIEGHIMAMEEEDSAAETAFRGLLHTMKGEAGLIGLEDLEKVCHGTEDFLGTADLGEERRDHLLNVKDWITHAIESYAEMLRPEIPGVDLVEKLKSPPESSVPSESTEEKAEDAQKETPEVVADTEFIVAGGADTKDTAEPAPQAAGGSVERDAETIDLLVEFTTESGEGLARSDEILMEAEEGGADKEMINEIFRAFHTIKGVAGFLELKETANLAHVAETLLNQIRQGEKELQGRNLDLIFDSVAMMRKMMDGITTAIEEGTTIPIEAGADALSKNLEGAIQGDDGPETQTPAPAQDQNATAEENVEASSDESVPPVDTAPEQVKETASTPADKGGRSEGKASSGKTKIKETIKIELERVDNLVEMIGELVIVETMVAHAPEIMSLNSLKVRDYLGQLGKISRDLQDVSMRMRMVPVRGVFQKMARLVRDLSRKSGKEVRLIMSGESTEMDRSMVEQINDPLVHMIRNSVDHGIDPLEERIAANKPRVGRVNLSAYHEGGSIVIEITDDGRGLNRDKIRAKAIKNNIIKESDVLTDDEVLDLIWAPGFSTADKVTEVSGRGVGMDVVRRNIESMRGRVNIQSVEGEGTTFKIILPLTLAIIDGMLVQCGEERYIIPTLSIIESVQPDSGMLHAFAGRSETFNLRGETLPLLRLDRLFGIEGAKQEVTEGLVVVVEGMGRKVGVLIDDVITQQQVVIKSLGTEMGETPNISGAAILSDGQVGLILNVEEICSSFARSLHR